MTSPKIVSSSHTMGRKAYVLRKVNQDRDFKTQKLLSYELPSYD
jgi:hypothetical protein